MKAGKRISLIESLFSGDKKRGYVGEMSKNKVSNQKVITENKLSPPKAVKKFLTI